MPIEGGEGIITGDRPSGLEEEMNQFPPHLVKAIQLGIEVEAWLAEPVGVYLYDRAVGQITAATESLLANPDIRSEQARADHDQARIANLFLDWLNDALSDAREAQATLEEEYGQEEGKDSY